MSYRIRQNNTLNNLKKMYLEYIFKYLVSFVFEIRIQILPYKSI